MHFKIIFKLDGTGVYYNPAEPIHLDSLLAWVLAPIHSTNMDLSRDDIPSEIPLPLMKKTIGDTWVWQASALFPEGETIETLQYVRKRLRESRIELIKGSPNVMSGPHRGYNIPLTLLCCTQMAAYASGNRKAVKKLLKQIKSLGKKRNSKVVGIDCEETEENWSMIKDGKAMRWLPDDNGNRLVRPRPPYWNVHERVKCIEVGNECRV